MEIPKGLAGVVVDESGISTIDGEAGALRYRGHDIDDIARNRSFLEVVGLVLDGRWPTAGDRTQLEEVMASRRSIPAAAMAVLEQLPPDTHPMTALQVTTPLLDDAASKCRTRDREPSVQRALLLEIAVRLPTVVATWHRIRTGSTAPRPDPDLPIHADFLRMLNDRVPEARDVETLDRVQILQMEHGFNASTFTARVVASSLAPASMTIAAAIASLHGPLHGGADEAAYRAAQTIGGPGRAAHWVEARLQSGEKIMGMGHREYRVLDPRARLLKELADEVAVRTGQQEVLATLEAIEREAARLLSRPGRTIRANVEFYKGVVLSALGIPSDLFTSVFAMARVYGWCAHLLEQWSDNRIYRPRAALRAI